MSVCFPRPEARASARFHPLAVTQSRSHLSWCLLTLSYVMCTYVYYAKDDWSVCVCASTLTRAIIEKRKKFNEFNSQKQKETAAAAEEEHSCKKKREREKAIRVSSMDTEEAARMREENNRYGSRRLLLLLSIKSSFAVREQ